MSNVADKHLIHHTKEAYGGCFRPDLLEQYNTIWVR